MGEESRRTLIEFELVYEAAPALERPALPLMRPWLRDSAATIWANTGLRPVDIDALYIQDPTAVWSLQMLEYYGFCGIGEGGPFLAEGHTLPGGSLR